MKIAFIVGSSRSGTSILGELIASHPETNYVFEEEVWKKLVSKKDGSHVVSVKEVDDQKKKKLRSWMACYKKGEKIIIEKNPRHIVHLPLIKDIFPEAKIIHIVRDGRDVACSLKSGLCGKTWAHVKPPRWKEIEKNYEGVIRCAWAWRDIMEIAVKDLTIISHLRVRYEDLIKNPQGVAKDVMRYLEIENHEKVIKFCDRIQNETKNSYSAKNQSRWSADDHENRIGRWKENMTESEKLEVEKILRPLLNKFGYK